MFMNYSLLVFTKTFYHTSLILQSLNGDHLRMSLDDEQQARHSSWVENDGSQPKVSPEEMLLLSQRLVVWISV